MLNRIKNLPGPILLHVLTKKGKGFTQAEKNPEKYHGIKPTASSAPAEKTQAYSYTEIFGKTLTRLAERSEKVCAITAAMCDGTGLKPFAEKFPGRFFDVGIAEGHAVTFAAGLAASGMRPVAAIYSTFLQRAFDQIIHDVALQRLPVIFALDRAGLVGEDGPTHHGAFDLSYLNTVPDLVISAPKDGRELRNLLYTALLQDRYPFAIRYPRDKSPDRIDFSDDFEEIPVGSWEVVHPGSDLLILAVGTMVNEALQALPLLREYRLDPTIVNCRFIKPLDEKMLELLLSTHSSVYTIEENAVEGGFGQKISAFLVRNEHHSAVSLHLKGIPDEFIEHGARNVLLDLAGLSAEKIAHWILETRHIKPVLEKGKKVKSKK